MKIQFERIKNYLKESFLNSISVFITISFMDLITYIVFVVLDYSLSYYWVIFQSGCLFYFVYLIVKTLKTRKNFMLKEENAELKRKIVFLKEKYENDRIEINDYFVTWVHQIKTPITALKLLLDTDSNQISKMKNELIHIENYTNNALNFVKLIDNEKDMDFVKININDILLPIIRRYSVLFITNNVELKYEVEDIEVITDSQWTGVLFEQIISNAVKYAKNKTVKIYLENNINSIRDENVNEDIKTDFESNDILKLVIEDNGVGIKKEDLPKIFYKGYSGFNGRMNQKSTGVGLFIAKKIANKLGIKIEVDSIYGVGTKVSLSLTDRVKELYI